MKKKILRVILLTLLMMLLFICGLLTVQMISMQKTLMRGSEEAGQKIEGMSAEAMGKQAGDMLMESAEGSAEVADQEFSEFFNAINLIAASAEDIYTSPQRYGVAELKYYDEKNKGELVTYAAYGNRVDPNSEEIIEELNKISNMQGMMVAINQKNDSMASDYFATASGIFLGTETVSEYNLPKDGKPLLFEARERPWYTQAVEKNAPIFTGIIKDVDTGKEIITCGVPVYVRGVLKGVAGAGMYLNEISENVDNFSVGENGYACIINSHGQILFSGSKKGELATSDDSIKDLRSSSNKDLAGLAKKCIEGGSGIDYVDMDGRTYYVAYAPMETVGWSYLTVLPEQEVLQPTMDLVEELNSSNRKQGDFMQNSVKTAILFSFLVIAATGLVAVLASTKLADRLAAPVVRLTDSVSKLEGDSLDFEWNIDTKDEVQTLADSFGSMTKRMKQYIEDITTITAEKERIGAELSVATHIQASMLPCIFPPFPDRKEFDLYAKMDPAKEVGGDFYDFFFIDKEHLALVMADVSGKGIPAALFMVIAKTLIKNHAQAGESVEDVLMNSNDQLCEGNGEELFVTAWLGIVDLATGVMKFCDAGHENPYIIHDDGTIEVIKPPKKKPPLAAMEGMKYMPNELVIKKGDCLFLYTDGVPEATNADNELYGTDRLENILKERGNDDPETLLADVRADVDAFVADAPQFDDLTMLAFRFHMLTGEVNGSEDNA